MIKDNHDISMLIGNIGFKVHFITFVGQKIRFVDLPCNCEAVFLTNSSFDPDSEKINSKFLIVEPSSHAKMNSNPDLLLFFLISTIKVGKPLYECNLINWILLLRPRSEVHRDGDWHKAVHIWILNEKGDVLLQRRCPTKDSHPNMLDISCAGHLSAGDDSITAATRELEEELGIVANPSDLLTMSLMICTY